MSKILITLFTVIILTSCVRETSHESDYYYYLYQDDFVDLSERIAGENDTYLNLGQAIVHDEQGLVLYDQIGSSFLHIDFDGNVINSFGSKGRGPYEHQMFTKTYLSDRGDFYVYDASMSKIIIYSNSGEMSEFFIDKNLVDMAVNSKGEILVYHLTVDDDHVLTMYDASGHEIRSDFSPNDKSLKLFLNRYRDGGLSYSLKEDVFYFLYPEEYVIHVLSNDLKIIRSIPLQNKTTFPNGLLPMPQNLNPFGMSQSHVDYWISFHHPSDISLYDSEYILVKNYEMFDQNNWQIFYNLFSTTGEPVFEGLIIPDSVNIINTDSQFINLSQGSGIARYRVR